MITRPSRWAAAAFLVHTLLAAFAILDNHFIWTHRWNWYKLFEEIDFMVEPLTRWRGWLALLEPLSGHLSAKVVGYAMEVFVFVVLGGGVYALLGFLVGLGIARGSRAPDTSEKGA